MHVEASPDFATGLFDQQMCCRGLDAKHGENLLLR